MVITDKFVFIHVPKTGGSFIRSLFQHEKFKHLNPQFDYFHHAPANAYEGHLPIIYVKRYFETWVKSWERFWSLRPKESTNPFLAVTWSGGDKKKYYDLMYLYMTNTGNKIYEIPFENLNQNLFKVLKELDAVDDSYESFIASLPKVNETPK